MKHRALYLGAVLALTGVSIGSAADGPSKDEQRMERVSAQTDKDAEGAEGQKAVESRLESEYKVDDARIQGLRDQKMGYGEISIALALAEKRTGGITDANVAAVMAERNGPPKMGWGQIAKKQGTTIGKLEGRVKGVRAPAAEHHKAAKMEHREKHERAERHERPEKMAKPEKPENPKH